MVVMTACRECPKAARIDIGYLCFYHCKEHDNKLVEMVDTYFNEREYYNKPCEEDKNVKENSEQ